MCTHINDINRLDLYNIIILTTVLSLLKTIAIYMYICLSVSEICGSELTRKVYRQASYLTPLQCCLSLHNCSFSDSCVLTNTASNHASSSYAK